MRARGHLASPHHFLASISSGGSPTRGLFLSPTLIDAPVPPSSITSSDRASGLVTPRWRRTSAPAAVEAPSASATERPRTARLAAGLSFHSSHTHSPTPY